MATARACGLTRGAWRRSLFAGCTERAEIVEYVTAHSDFGADTKHGARSTISDVITCEVRKQEQPFWRLANDGRLLLTAEGEALRGSKELQAEDDESLDESGHGEDTRDVRSAVS